MLLTTFYTIYYSHKEYIYQVTTSLKKNNRHVPHIRIHIGYSLYKTNY